MKETVAAFSLFLLIIIGMSFFSNSCGLAGGGSNLDYVKKNFTAIISGKVDGENYLVNVFSLPDAKDGEIRMSVLFSEPKALEGMRVSISKSGECALRLESSVVHGEEYLGLVEPYLLFCEGGTPSRVSTEPDGGRLFYFCDESCDLTLQFEKGSGTPSRISGKIRDREIDLRVEEFAFN